MYFVIIIQVVTRYTLISFFIELLNQFSWVCFKLLKNVNLQICAIQSAPSPSLNIIYYQASSNCEVSNPLIEFLKLRYVNVSRFRLFGGSVQQRESSRVANVPLSTHLYVGFFFQKKKRLSQFAKNKQTRQTEPVIFLLLIKNYFSSYRTPFFRKSRVLQMPFITR